MISAYELYLAVYRRVGALVRAEVPETTRKVYGETQEPELTVLKGVGPFAVALYRGAPVMSNDVPVEAPPAAAAVREVSREASQQAYQKVMMRGVDSAREHRAHRWRCRRGRSAHDHGWR